MDMNTYALEQLVESKLDQLRVDAARSRLLGSLQRHPRGVRSVLAFALLRAGRRLSGRGVVTPRTA